MNKCKYILDSHQRCEHLQADKIRPILMPSRLNETDKELLKASEECLSKNKSTFFALFNSFFTITDCELTVLNCVINKNSNIDLKDYIPKTGTILKEDSFGTNAIALSSFKRSVAYVIKEEHYRKQSRKLTCVAAPVHLGDKIIGYISFSTVNKWEVNGLRAFVESLSNNISDGIIKARLKNKLNRHLLHKGRRVDDRWIVPFFTEKERQIIEYAIKAYPNELIAEEACISEATVRTYLKRIFDKCGTKNRIDTAIFIVCSEIMEATKL